jgi:hypothetical protein
MRLFIVTVCIILIHRLSKCWEIIAVIIEKCTKAAVTLIYANVIMKYIIAKTLAYCN